MRKVLSVFVILGLVLTLIPNVLVFAMQTQDGLVYEYISGGVKITGYNGTGGSIQIPNTIDSRNVISIGDYAFNGKANLSSVTIPSTVTSIGDYAFNSCSDTYDIYIPSSVTYIGTGVFNNCNNLIVYPAFDSYAADYALSHNMPLIYFNCSTGMINSGYNLSGSISIPNWVNGATVSGISAGAFADATNNNLTCVNLSEYLQTIENNAFAGCTNLSEVWLCGSALESIGSETFWGCTSLTTFFIPDSVTYIGSGAFANCPNLNLDISSTNPHFKYIDRALYTNEQTESTLIEYLSGGTESSYTVPDNVSYISNLAFSFCSNLDYVYIHCNVESIGEDAFYGTNNVTIVTTHDTYAANYAISYSIPIIYLD